MAGKVPMTMNMTAEEALRKNEGNKKMSKIIINSELFFSSVKYREL